MATESLPTIHGKAQRHIDYWRSGAALRTHGVCPRVAWIVPDLRRAAGIEAMLGRLPAETPRLFAVTTRDQAIGFLTSEARS